MLTIDWIILIANVIGIFLFGYLTVKCESRPRRVFFIIIFAATIVPVVLTLEALGITNLVEPIEWSHSGHKHRG